jgi:hypothetical protein
MDRGWHVREIIAVLLATSRTRPCRRPACSRRMQSGHWLEGGGCAVDSADAGRLQQMLAVLGQDPWFACMPRDIRQPERLHGVTGDGMGWVLL